MDVIAAATLFAVTDLDDLVVLTALFLAWRATGRPRPGQIVAGQYLGIGALLAVSALAAAGLAAVPDRWVRLIGLVPLALGIRGLLRIDKDDQPPVGATGTWSVATLTVAGGADNISVYVPVLRAVGPAEAALIAAVFAVLVAVWCGLAAWLGGRPRLVSLVERWGHWLVPAVFIALGVAVLAGAW